MDKVQYQVDWVQFLRTPRPHGLTYLSQDMSEDIAAELEQLRSENKELLQFISR